MHRWVKAASAVWMILFLLAPTGLALGYGEPPFGIVDPRKLNDALAEAKAGVAANDKDVNALRVAGVASHQLARLRVSGTAQQAVDFLTRAVALAPDDAELLAYLGSAHAMLGRDSSSIVSKLTNVNRGLSELDKAVRKNKDNLRARLLRGSVSYEVPKMFDRKQVALDDYTYVAQMVQGGRPLEKTIQAEVYYKLGALLLERNDRAAADNYFFLARTAAPASDWGLRAEKERRK